MKILKKTLAASLFTLFLLAMASPVPTTAAVNSQACLLSSGKWVNASLSQVEARDFRITYDATPSASTVDAVTGLSSGPASNFPNLAVIARFNSNGTIDAMNGSSYTAASVIRYSARTTYHFILDVNIATHTYNAYVMLGSIPTTIGSHLAFRSEQAKVSTLAYLGAMTSPGTHTVCNIALSNTAVAPAIITQPTSRTVTIGQLASFSIATTGTAPLSYQWKRNGVAISGATSASYATPVTTAADNGMQFSAVVRNSAGTATSHVAVLIVKATVAAPSISTQPLSQNVTAGQSAKFSVVAGGIAPLTYQWSKNGSSISGAVSSSYATPVTSISDNGAWFAVLVRNSAGVATSNAVTLNVKAAAVAPSITVQPLARSVVAGQAATFSVTTTGTGPMAYQWKKTGSPITGAISSSYTTVLTTPSDNGAQFTVLVSNSAGNVTSIPALLTVKAAAPSATAPAITTQPVSRTVVAGQPATFSVVASGTATLTYQWKKNGTALSGATSASYTTPAATVSDNAAQFSVLVSNATGSATSNPASLTVSAAATVLLNSSSNSLNFGSVSVSSSSTENVTLTNAGKSNVTISQVLVAGAGFNSTSSNGIILSPGQSTTLTATFAPSTNGTVTGKITVSSNASNSPASISLSGTGVAAASHSVALSWTGDASGVTGFNTYSSAVSGGPFVKLTSTPLSSPSYTDTSVQPGRTYYYVVTAVNSSNQESTYSSEVTAIVP